MAYATNKALYHPTGGRGLYLASSGRMLYHAVKPFSLSSSAASRFYGSAGLSGSTAWTNANYEAVQDDALDAFEGDTSLSTSAIVENRASAQRYYGEQVNASVSGVRYTFSLPANSRGNIRSFKISAACGGWTSSNWQGISSGFSVTTWNGLSCTLNLMLTTSSTSYGSGNAMQGATPDDAVSISSCNAAQAGDPPSSKGSDTTPGAVLIDCPDLVDVANDLDADTIYLWAYIARSGYFPFLLADPEESTFENDFSCQAIFILSELKLLVA
jgi:hypothetical protein